MVPNWSGMRFGGLLRKPPKFRSSSLHSSCSPGSRVVLLTVMPGLAQEIRWDRGFQLRVQLFGKHGVTAAKRPWESSPTIMVWGPPSRSKK
jgi:hypothetical protein